jgi:cytidyltransferase-like protein
MGKIIQLDEWHKYIIPKGERFGDGWHGKYALTSGGFAPIHAGHISCIQACKKFAQRTIVVVNGDKFLVRKHGKAFQDIETRCRIVAALEGVDYVIPFEHDSDNTVNIPLEALKPDYFIKGGDRTDESNIPEWSTCVNHGIQVKTGQGDPKLWSSSNFCQEWFKFKVSETPLEDLERIKLEY